MKRKQFLHYLGASLGAITLAPVLTACGGGGDELASTATPDTLAPSLAVAPPTAPTAPTAPPRWPPCRPKRSPV